MFGGNAGMGTHGELAYSAEAEARDARFALGRL